MDANYAVNDIDVEDREPFERIPEPNVDRYDPLDDEMEGVKIYFYEPNPTPDMIEAARKRMRDIDARAMKGQGIHTGVYGVRQEDDDEE